LLSFGYDDVITDNGRDSQPEALTQIPPQAGQPADKLEGTEHYVVEMMTDSDDEFIIATDKIEIFPVPDGHLAGIEDEAKLAAMPDELEIVVNDPYPGSHYFLVLEIDKPNSTAATPNFENIRSLEFNKDDNLVVLTDKSVTNSNPKFDPVIFSEWEKISNQYSGSIEHGDVITFYLVSATDFSNGETLIEVLDDPWFELDNELTIRGSINSLND